MSLDKTIIQVEDSQVMTDAYCCIGCGYNLRTLKLDGCCPECGKAVKESLSLVRNKAVLLTLSKGFGPMKTFAALLGIAIMFLLLMMVVEAALVALGLFGVMSVLLSFVALAMGVKPMTVRLPCVEGRVRREGVARFVGWVLCVMYVMPMLTLVFMFSDGSHKMMFWFGVLSIVGAPLAIMLFCWVWSMHVGELGHRLGMKKLSIRMMVMGRIAKYVFLPSGIGCVLMVLSVDMDLINFDHRWVFVTTVVAIGVGMLSMVNLFMLCVSLEVMGNRVDKMLAQLDR
ncbi:hypothetical protein JD969_13310 [Planctomycetota bacterium]|nr:hypothetical protein JD969_13310 [Planctomycetota bacterium]